MLIQYDSTITRKQYQEANITYLNMTVLHCVHCPTMLPGLKKYIYCC